MQPRNDLNLSGHRGFERVADIDPAACQISFESFGSFARECVQKFLLSCVSLICMCYTWIHVIMHHYLTVGGGRLGPDERGLPQTAHFQEFNSRFFSVYPFTAWLLCLFLLCFL